MKRTILLALVVFGALGVLGTAGLQAQNIDSMAPVVVKTVPEAGSKDVEPGEMEVKVTFSKAMMDKSWSWSTAWQNSGPEIIGEPKYLSDGKTCVVKVKLEPGKTYGWWINSQRFTGFKDKQGHPAVPYLFVFKVKEN